MKLWRRAIVFKTCNLLYYSSLLSWLIFAYADRAATALTAFTGQKTKPPGPPNHRVEEQSQTAERQTRHAKKRSASWVSSCKKTIPSIFELATTTTTKTTAGDCPHSFHRYRDAFLACCSAASCAFAQCCAMAHARKVKALKLACLHLFNQKPVTLADSFGTAATCGTDIKALAQHKAAQQRAQNPKAWT